MSQIDTVIAAALAQIGKPYVWASDDPNVGFDCSGLTRYAYGQIGIKLGSTTYEQMTMGTAVEGGLQNALPGDLVFPEAGHVQLYLGNDEIVEAPTFGETVVRRKEWATTIFAIRRLVSGGATVNVPTGNGSILGQALGITGALDNLVNKTLWFNIASLAFGTFFVILGLAFVGGRDLGHQVKKIVGVVQGGVNQSVSTSRGSGRNVNSGQSNQYGSGQGGKTISSG